MGLRRDRRHSQDHSACAKARHSAYFLVELNFPAWHRWVRVALVEGSSNEQASSDRYNCVRVVCRRNIALGQCTNRQTSIVSTVAAADEAAIRAILDRQTDAWNRHDMDAFVADTMPDVDWINVVGRHWRGRETVLKAHAALHKGMFANSRMLTPEITMMREIAPNVIVETHVNRIEGAGATPSGAV
jgi:uncharacterized protein (TIGR02246 family)